MPTLRAEPAKFEAEEPPGGTGMQSLLWPEAPCLFPAKFEGAACDHFFYPEIDGWWFSSNMSAFVAGHGSFRTFVSLD